MTHIRLSWTSGVPAKRGRPFVNYSYPGKGNDGWKRVFLDESKITRAFDDAEEDLSGSPKPSETYSAADMCESPANITAPARYRHPGYVHTYIFDPLPSDKVVEYMFG